MQNYFYVLALRHRTPAEADRKLHFNNNQYLEKEQSKRV